jgi:hypothetical protein
MTEDEIYKIWDAVPTTYKSIVIFANMIAAKQREQDAQICEAIRDSYRPMSSVDGPFEGADFCVDAIREQSK